MSDIAIQALNLGKEYRLGAPERYHTFRDSLVRAARAPMDWLRRRRSSNADRFWALRDVSFDVRQGEVIGIVGRNGAGKSTLLKVLSRITEPSAGYADVYGRVGSLLEVGTGFHNELSGRDNIFMSGSILGMRRGEIRRKFDEIVAFSEVEKFLDTPVKRYSSGMYMRLAFAVAAHLEPEILVVDEVLAVGDAAFQKKCLGKMQDVAGKGRTVLFVSHNMAAVQALCTRAIRLEQGRVAEQGPVEQVVAGYLRTAEVVGRVPLGERRDRRGDGGARVVSLCVAPADPGDPTIRTTSRLKLTIGYEADAPLVRPVFTATINDVRNITIYACNSEHEPSFPERLPARGEVTCITDRLNLTAGRCYVNVEIFRGGAAADEVEQAAFFDVEGEDFHGTGRVPGREWALCVLGQAWHAGAGEGETTR